MKKLRHYHKLITMSIKIIPKKWIKSMECRWKKWDSNEVYFPFPADVRAIFDSYFPNRDTPFNVELVTYDALLEIGIDSVIFEKFTDCFIVGTLVLTSIGLVKIENIKEGDFVYAYDEKTKKKSLKVVAQIFRNKTKEWVHLFVKNPKTNKIQEIVCTPNHRIYIKNKGWIKTIEILENDKVLLYNGGEAVVVNKEVQKLENYETIYNFEVEELHNYFVGTEKVLVHNDCFPKRW